MKQPKPERLVVTLGIPITVHSAARETERGSASDQLLHTRRHTEEEKARIHPVIGVSILY